MNDQHRANLLLLAERLEQLPADYDHFNMSGYFMCNDDWDPLPNKVDEGMLHTCGTTACAVGHAPLIEGMEALRLETWSDYEERVFGLTNSQDNLDAWAFMFGPSWAGEDDSRHHTAHAAAKRIRHFLAHGTPAIRNQLAYIDA